MKIPLDVYLEFDGKFRTHDIRFPGIDFKACRGHQVVIPGSYHAESTNLYHWDNDPHQFQTIPAAPAALLHSLRFEQTPGTAPPLLDVPFSSHELAQVLSNLDVSDYDDHDTWFDIMVASYHATGGDGLEAFLDWSTSDPRYATHGKLITTRWYTLGTPSPSEQTLGYFLSQYRDRRLQPLKCMRPHQFELLEAELPSKKLLDDLAPEPDPPRPLSELRAEIETVSPGDSLDNLLWDIAKTSPLERCDLITTLSKQLDTPEQILQTALRGVLRDQAEPENGGPDGKSIDVSALIVDLLLRRRYHDGMRLINARDQRSWSYNGIVWAPVPGNQLDAQILSAAKEVKNQTGLKFAPINAVSKARQLLDLETTQDIDLMRSNGHLDPVVNTANCEIWVDCSGNADICKHAPEHYLTTAVPFPVDPKATCPTFDRMLEDIFSPCLDDDDIIDHLWEMIGYVIQPLKDLPHWWLFLGKGSDGKSTILSVLEHLLGDAALSKSLGTFDVTKNKHAYMDLLGKLAIIDDDLKIGTSLPDEFLKKATENKRVTADPKRRDTFQISISTSILVSSNHLPPSTDVSWAMRRRAIVVPCRRSFTPDEIDPSLVKRVIADELPGVLAKALKGLRRLRKRGRFSTPASCKRASADWLQEANQVAQFVGDCCEIGERERVRFMSLWESFKLWAFEEGLKRHYTRRQFRKTLDDMGYSVARGTAGRYQVRGLKLNEEGETGQ
jgi:P4 family phage/plasmid primase-like protien